MQKFFLTIVFFFTLIMSCSAFSDTDSYPSDDPAMEQTRKLANVLRLNEFDIIQIKNIFDVKLEAIAEANAIYSNYRPIWVSKIKEIENSTNAEILASLTPEQKTEYLAYLQNTEFLIVSTTK